MIIENIFICEFHRPEFQIPTFKEIIESLITTLSGIEKIKVHKLSNQLGPGVNIIFGVHRLFQSFNEIPDLPTNSIIFNLEPLYENSTNISHIKYIEILKKHYVIDYSVNNIKLLNKLGNNNTFRFKFGYTPLIRKNVSTNSLNFENTNKLYFYGALTSRRKSILEKISTPIKIDVNKWGEERDYNLIRS